MADRKPTIVVAGDICVDWLHWPTPPADEGLNWELYEGCEWAAVPGGALLLAAMLRHAGDVAIVAPHVDDVADLPVGQVLQSYVELAAFPAKGRDDKKRIYRIAHFRGYACRPGYPKPLPIEGDDPSPDTVILDDAGNGFRDRRESWPLALGAKGRPSPLFVYKMSPPMLDGELWKCVKVRDPERLVLVMNVEHLRAFGANISRRLSWERTVKDLVWQMACNPRLTALANVRHLVVRLGLEGALYYNSGPERVESRLFFDPGQIEGGYNDSILGQMQGFSDAFVAAMAYALTSGAAGQQEVDLRSQMKPAVLAGLHAARRLLEMGYGEVPEIKLAGGHAAREAGAKIREEIALFPRPKFLPTREEIAKGPLAEVVVPEPTMPEPPDPQFWCILKDAPGAQLELIAEELVRLGRSETLRRVPTAQFGKLRTADRGEIEGLRTVRNLIDEYLASESSRPLSIAVFGFPGSGKSFSVTEVANSIAGRTKIERLEFNLSQFRAPEDLHRAFHLVRDKVLAGIVPLVFFDEFDTAFGEELGWLKYFLAPMQDGKFREGETEHPIGKAIFVFAGGTHNTFQAFARMQQGESDTDEDSRRFRSVKGPDFVSRLRGHVNILGPNPVDDRDTTFIVRRAMLLRSLVERKARQILDSQMHARIDDGVLRALLRVPAYKHGARSMEAILDMSSLAGRTRFEQAALPPAEQMGLHVDADVFTRLLLSDVLLSASREELGRATHENYVLTQQGIKSSDDPAMKPWEELDERLRESSQQQADEISAKLRRIGCGLRPVAAGREPRLFQFTKEELEILAEMEHERWVRERLLAGWVYGPERDHEKHMSPYLVPWDELADEIKQWDRNAVAAIPAELAKVRFEIYRLGEV